MPSGRAGPWLTGGLACLTLASRLLAGPRSVDDAYITFRYARNLARGVGLVYNQGQHVLGTSTPLFALVLAALVSATGADVAWVAVVVSALADATTVLLISSLARRLGLPLWAGLMCAAAWSVYPVGFRYAIGGMETSVAAALALGACRLHLSQRAGGAIALAGLAVLVRPDMLALAAVLLVAKAVETTRVPWRELVMLGAVVAPWVILASWQYGTPVPQSLYAKSQAVYLAARHENTLQILYYLGGLALAGPAEIAAVGISVYLAPGTRLLPVAAGLVILAVWAIGGWGLVREDRRRAPLVALPLVFCAVYALVGLRGNLMAEWYLVPLAPFFFLGLFAGLVHLCRPLDRPRRLFAAIALGGLVVVAQVTGLDVARSPSWSLVPRIARTEREDLYRRAAEFLRPQLAPGDVVAASEIGALGYYCDCRILDTAGLVSPEAVRYYPLPDGLYAVNYAVAPDLIRDEAPAYLVSLDVFVRRSLESAQWFRRAYETAWQADTSVFGSRRLVVFRRVTPAPPHPKGAS
jgi:hypothetical protein